MHDKRKQSLYFPSGMLAEIEEVARRTDRSVSWVIQKAWKIAKPSIERLPDAND